MKAIIDHNSLRLSTSSIPAILRIYDKAVSSQKEYGMMTRSLSQILKERRTGCRILEVGVGTGMFSEALLSTIPCASGSYIGIDKDPEFLRLAKFRFEVLGREVHPLELADGVEFQGDELFDVVTMTLVYHHIETERKLAFLKRCFNNLGPGAMIAIGDVFLPSYNPASQDSWRQSLVTFHRDRLSAMTDSDEIYLEKLALKDGLRQDGEWKVCLDILTEQLSGVGFVQVEVIPVSADRTARVGGYFIVIALKPPL